MACIAIEVTFDCYVLVGLLASAYFFFALLEFGRLSVAVHHCQGIFLYVTSFSHVSSWFA